MHKQCENAARSAIPGAQASWANDQTMIMRVWRPAVLYFALSALFAGTISAVPQGTAPGRATLPTVNGAAFTSGPLIVDDTHCGWNYVLGGGAFYTAAVPSATGFPQGCTVTITNTDSSACKGKSIQVAGLAEPFVLWPSQA